MNKPAKWFKVVFVIVAVATIVSRVGAVIVGIINPPSKLAMSPELKMYYNQTIERAAKHSALFSFHN